MRTIRTAVRGVPGREGDRVITPLEAMVSVPGWTYERTLIDGRGERSGVFEFSPHVVGELVGAGRYPAGVVGAGAGVYAAQRSLVRSLLAEGDQEPLRIEERALDIGRAVRGGGGVDRAAGARDRNVRGDTSDAHAESVRTALSYLDANAHRRVALADVGRAVHTSPAHFARVFKARTGSTIAGALNQIRLRRAMCDVLDTSDDLWSIASRNGFGDMAHLSRSFKTAFGVPPSALRGRAYGWRRVARRIGAHDQTNPRA